MNARWRAGDRLRVSVEGVVLEDDDGTLGRVTPAFGGRPGLVACFAAPPQYGWQVEVIDTSLPPEPPVGSIVLTADGYAAWRQRPGPYGWRSAGSRFDHEWADLAVGATVLHLPGGDR